MFLCSPKKIGGAYSRRVVRPSVRPLVSQSVSPFVRTSHSCPAHNFVIWSRILKLFQINDHHIETTCRSQIWITTLKLKFTAWPCSRSCPAHNFVFGSQILKLFHWNNHYIETTCSARNLDPYLEGQGHSMILQQNSMTLQQNRVRPITSLFKVEF